MEDIAPSTATCRPNDVLLGQRRSLRTHPGNIRLRQLVANSFYKFLGSTKRQEKRISQQIVEQIKCDNGRFMKQTENEEDELWVELSDDEALKKVVSIFRKIKKRQNPSLQTMPPVLMGQNLSLRTMPLDDTEEHSRTHDGDVFMGQNPSLRTMPLDDTEEHSRTHEGDVLMGRSRLLRTHPGNIRYRQLVENSVEKYDEITKPQEKKISQQIVEQIKRGNGRFLRQNEQGGLWVEVSDEEARLKIAIDLRFESIRGRN